MKCYPLTQEENKYGPVGTPTARAGTLSGLAGFRGRGRKMRDLQDAITVTWPVLFVRPQSVLRQHSMGPRVQHQEKLGESQTSVPLKAVLFRVLLVSVVQKGRQACQGFGTSLAK